LQNKKAIPHKNTHAVLIILFTALACSPVSQNKEKEDNGFKSYSRAMEQMQAKNYTDALDFIDEAIKINDRIAAYFELRGDIFSAMDSLDEALNAYSDAKNRRSFYPEIYIKTGDIHYKRNNYDAAIRDFRKAIVQRQEEPVTYLSLILCYIQQREYDVATNLLQEYSTQVTKQNKRIDPGYYILQAKIQFENKKYEDAILSMETARKIKKLSRNECIFYLRSLVDVGRLEDAYQLALEYKDVLLESDSHYIRGLYYFKKNNYKDALTQLELSIQKKTKIYEAYELLAEIYNKNGDKALADKSLNNAKPYKSYRLINIDHKF
jgi:Tfp pilus assembly protein PilF